MANVGVRNDMLINFGSHEANNDNAVFKDIAQWLEVRYLKVGDEIAVPDYENCEKDARTEFGTTESGNKKSLNQAERLPQEQMSNQTSGFKI